MSFFNKVLSSVGIGSATVDTVIESPTIVAGEPVSGVVRVVGGNAQQHINQIVLSVRCNYFNEETFSETDDDGESHEYTRQVEYVATLLKLTVSDSFDVEIDQELELPFSFNLPQHTPLSLGQSNVWIDTDLDIDYAIDKSDLDHIEIVPNEMQHNVLYSMEQLGFELTEVECEKSTQLGGEFVQEFEFEPRRGLYVGRLNEVEMLMVNNGTTLRLLIEIDRKAKGISGLFANMLGTNESLHWIDVSHGEVDDILAQIDEVISQHC